MKKILAFLCTIVILTSSLTIINAEGLDRKNTLDEKNILDRKIISCVIELKSPSIVEYAKMIKERLSKQGIVSSLDFRQKGLDFRQKALDLRNIIENYRKNITKYHQMIKDFLASIGSKKVKREYFEVKREYFNLINGLSVEIPSSFLPTLKKLPFIREIYPDKKVHTLLNLSVPLINADDVWKLKDGFNQSITGKNVTVALIDSGVDYTHPDLNRSYAGGYDFVNTVDINNDGDLNDRYNLDPNGTYHEWVFGVDKNGDGDLDDSYSLAPNGTYAEEDLDPMDDNGHGTHCAGIIVGDGTASNGSYRGVAPDAKLYAYKVINAYGEGRISDMLAALEKAVDPNGDGDTSDHMDIISMSIGLTGEEGDPDDVLSRAVDNAVDAGCVVVTAAGNDGPTHHTIVSPACARKAITVGASTHIPNSFPSGGPDHVAIYSSRGPSKIYSIKPDIVAPGGDVNKNYYDPDKRYAYGIISTLLHGKDIGKKVSQYYTRLGGTSMASPHVAGVVALIKQKHPDWTPLEIKSALRYTAKDLGYPIVDQGFGRVDALAAVKLDTPPPVAFLYNLNEKNTHVLIKGTAKARNFLSYTLYYKYVGKVDAIDSFTYPGNWKIIYEGKEPVVDGVLYDWNTLSLRGGWYLIKLVVKDVWQRKSFDLMFTYLHNLNIVAPDYVLEGEKFTVGLTNRTGEPIRGIIIFSAPFRIPRIRFASRTNFTAYTIFLKGNKEIRAVLRAYVFFPNPCFEKKTIIIINR